MQMTMKVATTLVLTPDELRIVGLALLNNTLKREDREAALQLNVEIQRMQAHLHEHRGVQLQKQVDLALQAQTDDTTAQPLK